MCIRDRCGAAVNSALSVASAHLDAISRARPARPMRLATCCVRGPISRGDWQLRATDTCPGGH
eukprot:14386473-Alexandrium_andersonii.AAC.1